MFRFLSIVFLAGTLLEIASIIWVGSKLGVLPTLLLLIAGGVVGVSLFRSAGANAVAVLRSSIQDQRIIESLAGTTMVRVLAGVLFMVPGFLSDVAGLLLLVLPMHRWIGVKTPVRNGETSGFPRHRQEFGQVIEGEAVEITSEMTFHPANDQKS